MYTTGLRISCLLLIGMSLNVALAQTSDHFKRKNAVYLELLGAGGLYSLNLDRILIANKINKYGIRAGFAAYGDNLTVRKGSAGMYMLTGAGNHHAEIGVNAAIGNRRNPVEMESVRENKFHLVPSVGYRYQKPEGGLFLRATFLTFISISGESPKRLFPWLGVSIGTSF